MSRKSKFFMYADQTDDRIPSQTLDPLNGFAIQAASNRRLINGEWIADETVTNRGAKNILWSSEGWTPLGGTAVVALTAAQKRASGNQDTNIGGTAPLDFSAYRGLLVLVSLTAISGGTTPTIQFGINLLDDTAPTAGVFPLWAPAAMSAAANARTSIAVGSTAAGDVSSLVGPQGQLVWTVAGGPTVCTWTAWLYGIN